MKINCSFMRMSDIDLLVENPRNPNKHGEKQIALLAKILDHQGWREPIVVSKRSGYVCSGHARLAAAKKNGWTKVPVDEQDFENEAQEYAHLIAANKIGELAEHDDAMMFEALKGFPELDPDLLGIPNLKPIDEVENVAQANDVEIGQELIIVLKLKTEQEMQTIYEEMLQRGIECKLLT